MDELKQQIEALKELIAIQKQTIETLKSNPKVIYTPYYIYQPYQYQPYQYQPYQYTYGAGGGLGSSGAIIGQSSGYASGQSGQFGK